MLRCSPAATTWTRETKGDWKGGWTARWLSMPPGLHGCVSMATGSIPRPSRRILPLKIGCCWRSRHVGRCAGGKVVRLTSSRDETTKAAGWPPYKGVFKQKYGKCPSFSFKEFPYCHQNTSHSNFRWFELSQRRNPTQGI